MASEMMMMELKAEQEAIARLIDEWKGAKTGGGDIEDADDDEDLYIKELKSKDEDEALREAMEAGKEGRFTAHVKVPTQKDIEEALLRRKKQELLEMLAIDSHDLDQLEKEAKLEPQEVEASKMELSEEVPTLHKNECEEGDVVMSEKHAIGTDCSVNETVTNVLETSNVSEKLPVDI